jgi:ComF family protein
VLRHVLPHVRRRVREGLAACAELVFFAACPGCGAEAADQPLCLPCATLLERRNPPWCGRCGEPLLPGQPCSGDHRALSGIGVHRAPLRYRGTGARLVHRLKFQRDLAAGRYLARAMQHAVGPWLRAEGRRALVVPVPRHASKRHRAAFDQAAWLARNLAARLRLPLAVRALVRTRPTLPQADPRVTSREANVAGAFACPAPWEVTGRTILLVDDVLTSGATARACTAALRAVQAARVAVVTAARA